MRGADLSKKYCSSIQYLSILGVFTLCHSGAASLTGATKSWLKRVVPSWTERAHCVTSTTCSHWPARQRVAQRCAPLVVAGGWPGSRSWKGRTIGQGRRRRRQAGISWQRAAERYVSLLCSLTTGDARMGGMDIIILILKLMVAVLQLLDAVLKQLR